MPPKLKRDDAPDDLSRRIMVDAVEMLSDQILTESASRGASDAFEAQKSMTYFFRKIDGYKKKHGRIYCLYRLAKIYAASCVAFPYKQDEDSSAITVLSDWGRSNWCELETSLLHLREKVIRKDSEWLDEESDELHPERGKEDSVWYSIKFNKILRLLKIQRALSGFRATLEEQVRSRKEGRPDVKSEAVNEFAEIIEAEFQDDEMAMKALHGFLVRSNRANTRSHGVALVSLEQLGKILQVKPFALDRFQKHLSDLLRYWARDITEGAPPTLVRVGYRGRSGDVFHEALEEGEEESEEGEEMMLQTQPTHAEDIEDEDSQEEGVARALKSRKRKMGQIASKKKSPAKENRDVENLKTARATLRREFEDPLEESRQIAASAVAPSRRTSRKSPTRKKQAMQSDIYAKKPSGVSLEFEDSDESEEESGVKLSAVPNRAKIQAPRNSRMERPDVILLNPDGTKKRRRFTEEEKTAIKEGVRKFGFGKWSKIKSEYSVILRNRTAVNIKDCYRTLMKQDDV